MTISTVNYHDTIFEHPKLTKITGISTYETLHLLHNKIKSNAMSVLSNLGGWQHGYLRLVASPTNYYLLTNTPFVLQDHLLNLRIPIPATLHAKEEMKRQYDEILRVFHKTRGVERALIQKIVLAVEAKYITAMRNRTTGQLTGTLFMLIYYLIVTYGKISPR